MAQNKRSAKGFPGAKEVGPELLFEKCDILILAAMEKALTGDNASKVNAKVSNRDRLIHLSMWSSTLVEHHRRVEKTCDVTY